MQNRLLSSCRSLALVFGIICVWPGAVWPGVVQGNKTAVDPLDPAATYGTVVGYSVYRNNKRIGSHTVEFRQQDEQLVVKVESDLVVRVLKIPVYRFNYLATETWQQGILQKVDATIREKGEVHEVSARRESSAMALVDRQGNRYWAHLDYASNHWHPGVLGSSTLFNTLTGKVNEVTIETVGQTQVLVGSSTVPATHYRYTGQLDTEVWYDELGRWVKLRFKGSDGSTIEYRCDGFAA